MSPIDVEQGHFHESTHAPRDNWDYISSAINSPFLLIADYSYLSVFTSGFSSARKITGLRNRQERNKPPTYLYYEREKYGRKKRQITRKVEPLRLS